MNLKFRAWDELRKIMYNSKCVNLLLHFDGKLQSIDEHGNILGTINTPEMKIMQFTGFKDNKRTEEYPKGQEIYTGDIVKIFNHPFDDVLHINGVYSVNYNDNMELCVGDWLLFRTIAYCEVIGNVFENPELLEGKDENNMQ